MLLQYSRNEIHLFLIGTLVIFKNVCENKTASIPSHVYTKKPKDFFVTLKLKHRALSPSLQESGADFNH